MFEFNAANHSGFYIGLAIRVSVDRDGFRRHPQVNLDYQIWFV
jgi:hypothetical protein